MGTGHAQDGHDATPGGAGAIATTPGDHASPVAAEWWILESVGPAVLVLALTVYLLGVYRHRDRGPWAGWRTTVWIAGLTSVGVGWAGPLAEAARHDFTAHMATHLLVGMIGPLLLVLAAPVTLALRTLPTAGARTVSAVLRSPPARVVTHPVAAAVLNGGGVWLLYATDLVVLMHHSTALHVLVHVHVLLAGIAFTVAMIGPDPTRTAPPCASARPCWWCSSPPTRSSPSGSTRTRPPAWSRPTPSPARSSCTTGATSWTWRS